MFGIGWDNPWPQQIGGGPTVTMQLYQMLREAVGKGGASTDDESIEAMWRQYRARALAGFSVFAERAAIEGQPRLADSLLEYYEDVLGLTPGINDSKLTRQLAANFAWTSNVDASGPAIESTLQQLDSRFSVIEQDRDFTSTTIEGRPFGVFSGSPAYGGGAFNGSQFPLFSEEMMIYVILSLNNGETPTEADLQIIAQAKDFLNVVLPSWVFFQVVTYNGGFILDLSLLDTTSLL